jgi:hypothetical protein
MYIINQDQNPKPRLVYGKTFYIPITHYLFLLDYIILLKLEWKVLANVYQVAYACH